MNQRSLKERNLYLVTGKEYSMGRDTCEVVQAAIRGGIDVVQMREKNASKNELTELGRRLAGFCGASDVLFIVNDDPILAREIGADGVHLGQEDLKNFSLESTREIIGQNCIIGLSTHSVESARQAVDSPVDYIAFGPIFSTKTKNYFIGKRDIPRVLEISPKPVVFIGGINGDNIGEVLCLGAKNIAMIRDITEAEDIEGRVRGIREKIFSCDVKNSEAKVRVNGNLEDFSGGSNIEELIRIKGLSPERVVVEHNNVIIPRDKWIDTGLFPGDTVEIITFVGGG